MRLQLDPTRVLILTVALALGQGARAAANPSIPGADRGGAIFEVRDFGTLGGKSLNVRGINDLGDVVGVSNGHAFLWHDGLLTDLMSPEESGSASGINNRGDIAGTIVDQTGSHLRLWRGEARIDIGVRFPLFIWINDRSQILSERFHLGGPTSFLWENGRESTLDGFRASALNGSGEVAGLCYDTQHACVWREGVTTDLGVLEGYLASAAFAINDAGDTVGNSNNANPYAWADRACLWQRGSIVDLGTLGGGQSRAWAINNRGQIVGSGTTADGKSHAFLWENGVMRDLGTLGGAVSQALDINDNGQVAGTSTTPSGETHAFFWQDGKMTDLWLLWRDSSQGSKLTVHINRRGEVAAQCLADDGNTHGCIYQRATP
jgi:probable HAF family extracellular repeat protein